MEQENIKHNLLRGDNFFVPLLLVVIAMLLMTGGRISQLLNEEGNLGNIKAGQEKPMEDARRVRTQFDSITTGTARLAAQGNPHAKMLLEELKKLGVTVQLPDESTQ